MAPSFSTLGAAVLAALPLASAHISMKHPVPFDSTSLKQDRSPLTSDQYPCKFQTYGVDTRTELSVGSSYTLDFYPGNDEEIAAIGSTQGAAVHDGGSCQLSITLDKEPTAKSVFKVFHSIQGGCPGFNQKTSSFQYQLPDTIPNGDVTLAWTWFPVSSYAPEMYMNCAPVTVSGGADDESAFNELPDMFVANLGFDTYETGLSAVTSLLTETVTQASLLAQGELPKCLGPSEHVLEFPNPGESLVNGAADVMSGGLAKPQGQCSGGSSGKASGSASSGSTTQSSSSSSATTQATTQATTLATQVQQSSSAASVAGIFAEASSSAATTSSVAEAAPAEAAAPATSAVAQAATSVAQVATTLQTQTSAAAAAAAPASTAASLGQANSACTDANDGQVVCNGESQYGLCNRGSVVFQDVAAGMKCSGGKVVGAQ